MTGSVEQIPVDSTASLHSHPVQGEVDLSDKWRHPLHHSVSYIQHYPGLLTHHSAKWKTQRVCMCLNPQKK